MRIGTTVPGTATTMLTICADDAVIYIAEGNKMMAGGS